MQRIKTLFTRLAAAVYDGMILVALWIFATLLLMPFTHGAINPPLPWNLPFDLYILFVSFLYLGGLWHKTGQTLGMRAWRWKVVNENGGRINLGQAAVRMFAGVLSWLLLGAGWLWMLFDRDELTLHDRLSKTRMVRLPKGNGQD
ncbi:MAG TPA: RDD family protein [Gammaproteobacteria bacterium]